MFSSPCQYYCWEGIYLWNFTLQPNLLEIFSVKARHAMFYGHKNTYHQDSSLHHCHPGIPGPRAHSGQGQFGAGATSWGVVPELHVPTSPLASSQRGACTALKRNSKSISPTVTLNQKNSSKAEWKGSRWHKNHWKKRKFDTMANQNKNFNFNEKKIVF